jgi:molecular chaperone Hsp33
MKADYCQRFIFEDFDVRGEVVQLEQSYTELLNKHHYPAPVAQLLGEFLSACVLLGTSIKYQGRLSLQARSSGPVPLIAVDCTSDLQVRGLAQLTDQALGPALDLLLADGVLAITIEPDRGERYQGLVPLEAGSLCACLERYFHQSEQLETRFFLAADGSRAAGFMLQQLPRQREPSEGARAQSWEHLSVLAQTVEPQELLAIESEHLLYRLYHQQQVRVFEPRAVTYHCTCSWERSANTLAVLGREEIDDILREREELEMTCEFCNQVYRFDRPSIERIFGDDFPSDGPSTSALH